MPTGYALHIGLNSVDPKHYAGWSGDLQACEADAVSMQEIATATGFSDIQSLLTSKATRAAVQSGIRSAASALRQGDLFLLSYSGHGGQLPDKNDDEPDAQDETWCLYDGELVDDEIFDLYTAFAPGVRVLVFSDSCHSGSVTRAVLHDASLRNGSLTRAATRDARPVLIDPTAPRFRALPDEVALATYLKNKPFYDDLLTNAPPQGVSAAKLRATVRLISGCQDNQLSRDGTFNGLFTSNMLKVWKSGAFKDGGYGAFHRAIVERMPSDQTPNHFVIGPDDSAFAAQKPFTI